MKASELNAMSEKELKSKELELRENIFRMKFKMATGDIEDSSLIRKAKKDIARIQTVLNQKCTEGK